MVKLYQWQLTSLKYLGQPNQMDLVTKEMYK